MSAELEQQEMDETNLPPAGATTPAAIDDAPAELVEKHPIDQPLTRLDARDLRSLFRAAYDWLAHNAEHVNRLNVFPVPDGDTGTNMLLTIKSAWNNIVHRADAATVAPLRKWHQARPSLTA